MPVKTRFLVLSDTHNASLAASDAAHPFRHPLPPADVLVHAGDLTMKGWPHEHDTTFDLLKNSTAELKLVIAGNHDLTLDAAFVATHPENRLPDINAKHAYATNLWKGPAARAAGITFLDEGTHAFTLRSGASLIVHASPYTPAFFDWAFMHPRDEDRYNPPGALHPVPDAPAPDLLVTHGPPAGHLGRTRSGVDAGCVHLARAVARARPLLHCFGHIHEAWGARRIDWARDGAAEDVSVDAGQAVERHAAYVDATGLRRGEASLLVNASVMDLGYKPRQAPWLVDLELLTVDER